ncbi:hypothetical protein ACMG4H_11270 [Corynebacterium glutamicum]|uniref:hypothetical protein n=1 Tax=Corynebacterium glutamicum TaxID=1718 RepID=UPI000943E529|nr:hypothetical protein [Corynebacterium glutamicum]OKX82310.1 hypothetical protein AUO95_06585 [Corynebacterium glutamicum]
MLHITMRLFQDIVEAEAKPIYLPQGPRALFFTAGNAHLENATQSLFLNEGLGMTDEAEMTIRPGQNGYTAYRWEVLPEKWSSHTSELHSAPQSESKQLLEAEFELDDRYSWLIRLDRVSFPAGGTAWTHLHQGPGIRVCTKGEITIDMKGNSSTYTPNQPWAEFGVLPVLAPTTNQESTEFLRCFLLPSQNRGESSLRIMHAEDRAKGNTQKYHVFSESILSRIS